MKMLCSGSGQRIGATALVVLFVSLVPCAFARESRQDCDAICALRKAFEQAGFHVTYGSAEPMNLAEMWCANAPGVESAWYSNYEPYIDLKVPKSADDPSPPQPNFQLRPDEAIVLIGPTPPPVKYFGFHRFLSSKVYPDGSRHPIHATLGDAVNNLTIRTIGPTPFSSPVALIFTPDKGTDARIRAVLQGSGYPEAIINTVVFPASMLNLGHGESADELRITIRSGPVWQTDDGDAYVADPPLTIMRVTPETPAAPDPFPAPRLRVRGTGQTEMDLMNKLEELRARIVAANPGLAATDFGSHPYWYEGFDYIQRGVDPDGDTRDCFFLTAGWVPEYGSSDEITLGDGEFLMVYGANHTGTGKATYASVNVYASETAKLLIGSVTDDDLRGSATPYLPTGDPAAKKLYAYKVSRNCVRGEPGCLQLSVPEGCTRLTLDSKTVLGLVFRMYAEPATKVGPAMPEILYDRIVKFSPRRSKPY